MVRYGQNHQVGDNTGSIFPRPRLFDIRISDRPHLRDIFERQKKDIDHYCSNCNAYIGTYHAGC